MNIALIVTDMKYSINCSIPSYPAANSPWIDTHGSHVLKLVSMLKCEARRERVKREERREREYIETRERREK